MKAFEIYSKSLKKIGILSALLATRFGTQTEISTLSDSYRITGIAKGTTTVAEIYNYAKGVFDAMDMEN